MSDRDSSPLDLRGPASQQGQGGPDNPAPTQLFGTLTRFVWQSPSGEAAIAVVQDQQTGRPWTVKGPLWGLHAGETVRLWGRVQQDPRWGLQFRVEAAQPALPQGSEGLRKWLSSGRLPGIGAVTAERIVQALAARPGGEAAASCCWALPVSPPSGAPLCCRPWPSSTPASKAQSTCLVWAWGPRWCGGFWPAMAPTLAGKSGSGRMISSATSAVWVFARQTRWRWPEA